MTGETALYYATQRADPDAVKALIEAGAIKPVIHRVFPLEQAAQAHTLMESSAHIGKIVLSLV